jgi:hypothetical protein
VYGEKIEAAPFGKRIAPEEDRFQRAASVARLGEIIARRGELKDCYTAAPEYLRLPEAERKLREKRAAEAAEGGGGPVPEGGLKAGGGTV